jgi:hypothetical protein
MAEVYPAPQPPAKPTSKRSRQLPTPPPPAKPKPKRSRQLLTGCLTLAGVLFACGTLSMLFGGGGRDQTAAPAVRTQTVVVEAAATAAAVVVAEPTLAAPTRKDDPAQLLPTAAASPTQAVAVAVPMTASATGQVASTANVRDIPSTADSTVVGQAATGDSVTIRGKTSDGSWYAVTLPGGLEGWMSATLVTVDADVVAAAAILATPIPAAVVPTTAPALAAVPIPTGADRGSFPCKPGQFKGNNKSAIYHSPGQRDYEKTSANVTCFDTAAQAVAAGFRAAKR